jgi:hypothetical protein
MIGRLHWNYTTREQRGKVATMTMLDVLETVIGHELEAPAILIDAVRRRVRKIQIKRSEIAHVLLKGEERLAIEHYRQSQLGYGDVMFYLPATVYWCGGLQPEHRYFFKIKGVSEPYSWRALVMSTGHSTFDLREFKRMVQFIDEPTARTMTDVALEKVENMTAALFGKAVQRWRPWETEENAK